ncbi:MAG: NADPH-dependent 2,4-dienoyl-CoA reductase, partial [Paracoccaceae bacterium]
GFDVVEFLAEKGTSPTLDLDTWKLEWGISDPETDRGGLLPTGAVPELAARQITLLQRKPEKLGRRLGKTTGWIHRAILAKKQVKTLAGVNYEKIDMDGIHISFGAARTNPDLIMAENVILCAGQVSVRSLADALEANHASIHVIGGADNASELDAKRAIDQGARLSAAI